MSDPIVQLIFLLIKAILMVACSSWRWSPSSSSSSASSPASSRAGWAPPTWGPWGAFQSVGDIVQAALQGGPRPRRRRQDRLQAGALHHLHPGLRGHGHPAVRAGRRGAEPLRLPLRLRHRQLRRRAGAVPGHGRASPSTAWCWRAGRPTTTSRCSAALRAGAQMISYELAMGFSVVGRHAHGQLDEPRQDRRRAGGQLLELVLGPADRGRRHLLRRHASPSSTARPSTWPRPSRNWWPAT